MRLNTLIALTMVGFGYAALTACDGGDKPEGDTDTDTDSDADADADTDSDTDTDTGATGGPTGPLVYISFKGANANYLAGTYSGGEAFGYYQFNTQPPGTPDVNDFTTLCEFTWTAANAANPAPACTECDWVAQVALSAGTETSVAAGDCVAFQIDAAVSDGLDFGYGYGNYNYQGTDYAALWYYDAAGMSWGAATIEGVSYDAVTGAFEYNWVTQAGYL